MMSIRTSSKEIVREIRQYLLRQTSYGHLSDNKSRRREMQKIYIYNND